MPLAPNKFVRVEVFARRFATGHEKDVVYHQCHGIWSCNEGVNAHGKRNAPVIDRLPEGNVLSVHVDKDVGQADCQKEPSHESPVRDEGEEITVVAATHAVV